MKNHESRDFVKGEEEEWKGKRGRGKAGGLDIDHLNLPVACFVAAPPKKRLAEQSRESLADQYQYFQA